MRTAFALAAVIALPLAAKAGTPRSLHDVPWYETHNAARSATLKLCHSDEAYGRLPDCANAERAADGVMYGKGASGDFLNDPEYWSENRIARAGALAQCNAGRGPALPYCAAVRQSLTESP
jgi:hypothetical protein